MVSIKIGSAYKILIILLAAFVLAAFYASMPSHSFVYESGGRLFLRGERFRFVGGNHYNLLAKYLKQDASVTGLFETSSEYNIRVMRFWATCSNSYWSDQCLFDGPNNWNSSKDGFFARFDKLVSDAESSEVYIMPVLVDGYDTFMKKGDGSEVCQVGSGSNLLYKEFVRDVVTRYKDSSAVLAWEIGNEGHTHCSSYEWLLEWYEDTARFIRSIDGNHLVSTGENNFGTLDKTGFISTHSIEGIGMTSVHIYLDDLYSIERSSDALDKVEHFISYWTDASHRDLRKPIVFGEFGADVADASGSVYFYGKFMQEAYELDADGVILWSWMEGPECTQDISYGGNCVSPDRTPAIAEEVRFWGGEFQK